MERAIAGTTVQVLLLSAITRRNSMRNQSPQSVEQVFASLTTALFKWPTKRHLTQGGIGLLFVGLVTGGSYFSYRQFVLLPQAVEREKTQTTAVETITLPITVTANGTVEPEQLTNVSPKTSDRLDTVLVSEGDAVQEGEIVAYMDDSDLQGQLIQAQGELAAAEANLAMLVAGNRAQEISQSEAALESAEASLNQAEEVLQRYEALYARGAISAEATTGYRTARDTARADVNSAQQALNLLRAGSRSEEISEAEAQVMQASGALTTIETQIEDTVIRAPFGGIVMARYADPGDFVSPSTAASETTSSSSSSILSLAFNYQVVANVAETDIGRIQPGQPASIRADAFPEQTFEGAVAQVAEQATVTSNVTSFEVRVNLSEAAKAELRPGMNVDVEFQAGELANVLVVPTVSVVREEQGEGVLIMGSQGTPQFRPIETGLTVNDKTEVITGLEGNEQIVLSAAEGLPENRRNIGGGPGGPGGGGPGGSRPGGGGGRPGGGGGGG